MNFLDINTAIISSNSFIEVICWLNAHLALKYSYLRRLSLQNTANGERKNTGLWRSPSQWVVGCRAPPTSKKIYLVSYIIFIVSYSIRTYFECPRHLVPPYKDTTFGKCEFFFYPKRNQLVLPI